MYQKRAKKILQQTELSKFNFSHSQIILTNSVYIHFTCYYSSSMSATFSYEKIPKLPFPPLPTLL